jgi:hypothetical protein
MTGMGTDGKRERRGSKHAEGLVYTESEDSCVVYGMPRAIVEAGLSDKSVPLGRDGSGNLGGCMSFKIWSWTTLRCPVVRSSVCWSLMATR